MLSLISGTIERSLLHLLLRILLVGLLVWVLLRLLSGLPWLLLLMLSLEELVDLLIELSVTHVPYLLSIRVHLLQVGGRGELLLLNLLLLLVQLHFQLLLLLLKKLQVSRLGSVDLRGSLLLIQLLVATNKGGLVQGCRLGRLLLTGLLLLLHGAATSAHDIVALVQVLLLLKCGHVGLLVKILSLLLRSIVLCVHSAIRGRGVQNRVVGTTGQVHLVLELEWIWLLLLLPRLRVWLLLKCLWLLWLRGLLLLQLVLEMSEAMLFQGHTIDCDASCVVLLALVLLRLILGLSLPFELSQSILRNVLLLLLVHVLERCPCLLIWWILSRSLELRLHHWLLLLHVGRVLRLLALHILLLE